MKKKVLLYAILSALLIMTVIFFQVYNKPHLSVKKEKAAFELSVAELVDAFAADETRAQAQYVGKVIQVRGPVKEMVRDDDSMILRMGDSSEAMGVSCYLVRDLKEEPSAFEEGDVVTVKGICNGMLIDIVLDNGIILPDDQ